MPWRIWPLVLVALFAISADVRGAAPTAISGDFAGLIDIGGGRKLYLECKGAGSPVVILEAGLRNRADIWSVKPDAGAAVFPEVAAFTRVCAYDRPGTTLGADQFSRSDPVPMPRTAKDAVADLHALLEAAAIPSPYVLVGHSTGGLIAGFTPAAIRRRSRGSCSLMPFRRDVQTAMTPEQWKVYDRLLLVDPPKELAAYKDLETIDFDVSFDQMRAASKATPLPPIPFIVISKGKPFALPPGLPTGCPQLWTGLDHRPERARSAPAKHAAPDCHQEQPLRADRRAAIGDRRDQAGGRSRPR